MPRNRTLRYIFSRAKQFLVTLVAVLGGATALNADVIFGRSGAYAWAQGDRDGECHATRLHQFISVCFPTGQQFILRCA